MVPPVISAIGFAECRPIWLQVKEWENRTVAGNSGDVPFAPPVRSITRWWDVMAKTIQNTLVFRLLSV